MSDVAETTEAEPEKKPRRRKVKAAAEAETQPETTEATEPTADKPATWSDVADASSDQPTIRNYRGVISVKLTDAELVAKGQALLSAMAEVDRLEDEKSEEAKRYKSLIDDAEEARDAIRRVMRARCEDRELDLREERCYRTHAIRLYRVDTEELVSEKPLATDEPLFGKAPSGELFDKATGEYSDPAPDSRPEGAIVDPDAVLGGESGTDFEDAFDGESE